MERKYGIIGDIHSNLDALNAVLDDARAQEVTDFVCLGDVVGYNACPSECIRIVRDELNAITICGNHDHYCSNEGVCLDDFQPLAASVIDWTRRQLSEADRLWLHDLPAKKTVGGFMMVHGTLDAPLQWGYVFDTLTAEASFCYQTLSLCFHGHTHVPVIYTKHDSSIFSEDPHDFTPQFGAKYFVNVGSVGQPRDGDPRSAYAIYTPKTRTVEMRRVPYDVESAQGRIRAAGLPARLADRLALGR